MHTRPLRGWMVLFIVVTAGLSAGLLVGRKHWPEALAPWRDWLSAHAAGWASEAGGRTPLQIAQRQSSESGEEGQFAAVAFPFPPDESGRLLRERLTPPRKVQVAAAGFADRPKQAHAAAAEDLTRHLKLPSVQTPVGVPILPDERRPAARAVPVLDSPPLAFELDPTRPERPIWLRPQLAYAPGPDPQRVPPPAVLGQPLVERPNLQDDPTAEAGRRSLLAPAPLAAPVLPPLLRLTIPDPFEYQRVVHLASPPADSDLAAAHFVRPELPVLPVTEPKKKK